MLYIIMCQSWEELEGLALIEGPDNFDTERAERELAEMLHSANAKYEEVVREACKKHGIPYLLVLAPTQEYLEAMKEVKEKAPSPYPNDIIEQWIDGHAEVSAVSHKMISFRTYDE